MRPEVVRRMVFAVLLSLASLLYPLAIWWSLGRWPSWVAAAGIALLAAVRAWGQSNSPWWPVAGGAAMLAVLAMLTDAWWPAKLYPVWVSLSLLAVFGGSLFRGMPIVERLARLQEPDLPESGIRYTRRVTQVWCGFFMFNALASLMTLVLANEWLWALYNGLVSYFLMGMVFAAEWLVRQRVKARWLTVPAAPTIPELH